MGDMEFLATALRRSDDLSITEIEAMEFLASCCIVGRVGGTRPAHRRRTPGHAQRERIRCPESGTKKRLKG